MTLPSKPEEDEFCKLISELPVRKRKVRKSRPMTTSGFKPHKLFTYK